MSAVNFSVPLEIVVVPKYVLVPAKVKTDVPKEVSPPDPAMVPEIVCGTETEKEALLPPIRYISDP